MVYKEASFLRRDTYGLFMCKFVLETPDLHFHSLEMCLDILTSDSYT